MGLFRVLRDKAVYLCIGIGGIAALLIVGFYSYPLFHTLAEGFSIVIAGSIFVIAVNTRQHVEGGYFGLLGVAYLFVALLDLFHTLAYPGMGIIGLGSTNVAAQLWMASRLLESFSILAALLLLDRQVGFDRLFFGYLGVFALILLSIFRWRVFPACFIEGSGLTTFKMAGEYLICGVLIFSLGLLWRRRGEFIPWAAVYLGAAMGTTMVSELAFTVYRGPYAVPNMIGHFLKAVSFYFIYKALIETGLRHPYQVLYRNLSENRDRLQAARDELEKRVRERTAELERTVSALKEEVEERERAQEELRRSEERFRLMAEHISDVFWIASPDMDRLLYVSPGFEQMWGHNLDVLDDWPDAFLETIHPDDRETMRDILRDPGTGKWDVDVRIVQHDGEVRWIRTRGFLICDDEGNPDLRTGVSTDITGQKRSQLRIQGFNEVLRLFMDTESRAGYLESMAEKLCGYAGCRCVGIRIRTPDGWIPYETSLGFDEDFLNSECWLQLGSGECVCTRVMGDGPKPQDGPVLTEQGSFFCNDMPSFFDGLDAKERGDYRGVCLEKGFRSVAVIPVRHGRQAVGALHVADEERGQLSPQTLEFMESIAPLIGEAVHRFNVEESRRAINRHLTLLSEANQAIVRAEEERELLQKVCDILVEEGGYEMSWVGYAEQREGKEVRPVGQAGDETGYLEHLHVTWDDSESGSGPTGTAIRTGEPSASRYIAVDPSYAMWREDALKRGYASSMAFPLRIESEVIGALSIYSSQPDAFHDEEKGILAELAEDISFGLKAIRTRQERERARRRLERSHAELDRRAAQLRRLASELTLAEERERKQLAQILHDDLQQMLASAKLKVEMVKSRTDAADIFEAGKEAIDALSQSMEISRSLTAQLSPSVLYERGLECALDWLGGEMEKDYGLKVDVRAEERAEPASEDVRVLLFRSVRELLFNVVKHAETREARVNMSQAEEGEILVTVSDDGVGFAPEDVEKRTDGAGFGLFSLRERLSVMGGTLEIDAAPGEGAQLTLRAPISFADTSTGEQGEPCVSQGEQKPDTGKTIRVVLADDHRVMRKGLADMLNREEDIEVVGEAEDGKAATKMVGKTHPDVAVMDVNMPELGGVEATRQIRRDFPGVAVIGLSMHEASDMAEVMKEAGAFAYVTKSAPAEDLLNAIRASCDVKAEPHSANGAKKG